MYNYFKKNQESAILKGFFINNISSRRFFSNKKGVFLLIGAFMLLPIIFISFAQKEINNVLPSNEMPVVVASTPLAATSGKKEVIVIPTGTVKANPFLPYRNLEPIVPTLGDVASYNLLEPPEIINENSDAARVMDTIVSGILYDKFSPSAILNIEGNDYLVKKGDVINNYKVINILKDSVTVQLGTNVYKAGIGEILTEGSLNYNDVSNLNNKFGGVQ